MYRNQNVPKKWSDPSKKAEMIRRDQIRQAYYTELERKKQGLPDQQIEEAEPMEVLEESVIDEVDDTLAAPEPKYFTQMVKTGWYNVIGPAGTPVNATLLKLDAAEKKAARMNNGANR